MLGIAVVLSLSACGASSDNAATPIESPAASEVVASDTENTTDSEFDAAEIVEKYVFTNTGSVEICELYLSSVDDEEWGPDQLEEQTIPVGEEFTLKNIPAGTYDAKAVGCNDAGELTIQLDITNQ